MEVFKLYIVAEHALLKPHKKFKNRQTIRSIRKALKLDPLKMPSALEYKTPLQDAKELYV
jgi:hypothetical protein